ncbi:MAG: T9SS type A sorting domain-containing protein, partial [Polaribacter sp.]|nr:T9SS type A sorting domain-containing protein [Polaribacter sp.]
MKRTFFLIFILFTFQLFSQDYIPLLKEGFFWDIKRYGWHSRNPCGANSISRYLISNDTIINDKTYKKIIHYPIIGTFTEPYNCLETPYILDIANYSFLNYYLREDISEKKVYRLFINEDNQKTESVLYDFSLKVGDKFASGMFFNEDYATVSGIEQDSEGRNIFYFVGNGSYSYTEGVGGENGFLFYNINYDFKDEWRKLTCRGDDFYNNSCNITLNNYVYDLNNLKIFPNPVNDILNIKNVENITVKIFSIRGKLLKKSVSKTNLVINVSSFPSGIYILEISNSTGTKRNKL